MYRVARKEILAINGRHLEIIRRRRDGWPRWPRVPWRAAAAMRGMTCHVIDEHAADGRRNRPRRARNSSSLARSIIIERRWSAAVKPAALAGHRRRIDNY